MVPAMIARARRAQSGFTLIELMIVVAIIGILASVAIPAFMKNARKAKSAEATSSIKRIYDASRSYIMELRVGRGMAGATQIEPQFPESEPITPAASCCANAGYKCPPSIAQWTSFGWAALRFSMDDPHYYRYEYVSTGVASAGAGSTFTARALGDLDCDGVMSTFEMTGHLQAVDLDVRGSAGFYMDKQVE
jgi:type IV pilus assembly protein PilA